MEPFDFAPMENHDPDLGPYWTYSDGVEYYMLKSSTLYSIICVRSDGKVVARCRKQIEEVFKGKIKKRFWTMLWEEQE